MAISPTDSAFSPRELSLIIIGLMITMFLAALDQTIVATALPSISAELKDAVPLSWVVAAYMVSATAVTAIYGKLSDLYGRRPLLQAAIIIFLIGSLLCGFARSMTMLVVFRAVQGLGGGGIFAVAQTTIADLLSPRERGRYQAYFAANFAFASVAGPVLGGVFADRFGWEWVFWINLPIGLVALFITQTQLKRLTAKGIRHKIDFAGALLLAAAICGSLLYVTLIGDGFLWHAPMMLGLLATSVLLFAATIYQERRTAEPIVPPRLFANPVYKITVISSFLTGSVMIGTTVFMPILLQLAYGMSAEHAGLMMIPLGIATVVGTAICGSFMNRTGRYKVMPLIGSVLYGLGLILLSLDHSHNSLAIASAEMVIMSLGTGFCLPVQLVAVQNAVNPHDLGSATATVNLFRNMGGSFGVTIFGVLLIGILNKALLHLPPINGLGDNPASTLIHSGVAILHSYAAPLQHSLRLTVDDSFRMVFRLFAGVALVNFLAQLRLPEWPLGQKTGMQALAAEPAE